MKYRNDIQELRGIAILFVFVYHFKSRIIPGGYIGVDIFFVISGYIISTIQSSRENDKIDILLFYSRRIKRLFPSSFCCLLCYYLYHPTFIIHSVQETEHYYDILSALLCFSNIRFNIITNSYFQRNSISILINYWSLSLEEQFYMLYPILFYVVHKNIFIIVIISVISYCSCIRLTYQNNSSSYYILYNRAWELLIGCMISFYNIKPFLNPLIVLYFLIISSYMIGILKIFKFPGYIALIPCILTSIELIQNYNILLKSNFLLILGDLSYIIYLFHYPIIRNNNNIFFLLFKLSVISFFLYHYIEFRIKKTQYIKVTVTFSIILSFILLALVSNSIKVNKNNKNIKDVNNFCNNSITCSFICFKNIATYNYSVLLIGDSHLFHYLSLLQYQLSRFSIGNIVIFHLWIINIEKNVVPISNLIIDMRKIILCIISLYVDYSILYTNKDKFEISFKYLITKILSIIETVIIFQDNPHRIRLNDSICSQILLPIIKNDKIKYINFFHKYCKGIEMCIKNIYSKELFRDFHHLNKQFICRSALFNQLLNNTLSTHFSKGKNNLIKCNIIDLRFRSKYNSHILSAYNIVPLIESQMKYNEFGFSFKPIFE